MRREKNTMRDALKTALLLALLALAQPAFAGGARVVSFDPTDFLKEQEFEAAKRRAEEAIETVNVVIGGRTYVKLTSQAGSIYLPKKSDLLVEDLDLALCDASFKPTDLGSALKSAAELRLTETVRRSTRLILDAIRDKCKNKL